MLNDFNCSCPIYIACGYTDLRRGIDGLASIVQSQFQLGQKENQIWKPWLEESRDFRLK